MTIKLSFILIVILNAMLLQGETMSRAKSATEIMERIKNASLNSTTATELCTRPGIGRIGIVSMSTLFSEKEFKILTEQFSKQLKFPLIFTQSNWSVDVQSIARKMNELQLDMAVFVVNESTTPMTLISLEERWGIINANILLSGDPKDKARLVRLRRAMARVFKALLCSGSTIRGVSAARTGKDLEVLPADPIDASSLMQMMNSLRSFGLRSPRTVPYYRACKEGWAPAPTNDIQKAIWDKVHAMPTAPIKIKPETKKVRE